jgi:CheY-like chemotaxis protein
VDSKTCTSGGTKSSLRDPASCPDVSLERGVAAKTILLLEENLSLRRMFRDVLQCNGYVIWEAANAQDAIRCFLAARRQIDLLLADVTLPVSSGIFVALLLRVELPGLPVILTPGDPPTEWENRNAADLERLGSDSVVVLQKPFPNQTLLNSIRKLSVAVTAARGTV